MLEMLKENDWKFHIDKILQREYFSCKEILSACEKSMNMISTEPTVGWLTYTYNCSSNLLFPENSTTVKIPTSESGRIFYLEVLRFFLNFEKNNRPINPKLHLYTLSQNEISDSPAGLEYDFFLKVLNETYAYEFMRIGKEITPFNTIAHISGVHFIAMHIGRQLYNRNSPVDLAIISAAAAGHDIGKFGCKSNEAKRIPHLHYYYTDQFFRRNNMPRIAHIAANHSVWDLELENLSVESLILIYSDFRVKSDRDENQQEIANFYSLKDSFQIILNKLENVDENKKNRYIKVYNKLKDFEEYMDSLGINTDLTTDLFPVPAFKDASLLSSSEVVHSLKNLAINHNISLMNKLSNETSFGNILEAARSEKDWKNIRAYLNILKEYFTYISQKQKIITLNFLYELLMHKEGDIRRQAAYLMADIIVTFDEEYRKELPQNVTVELNQISGMDLWKKYLHSIILPDHKVTDQHKRWIGYTLKLISSSVLKMSKEEDQPLYFKELLNYYENTDRDDSTAFILLDAMIKLPLSTCDSTDISILVNFAESLSTRTSLEIQIAALRFVKYLSENMDDLTPFRQNLLEILEKIPSDHNISAEFIKYKTLHNLGIEVLNQKEYDKKFYDNPQVNANIFLENFKGATPWVIKAVNIELLLDQVHLGNTSQVLHIGTHFSNLIKVSERVAVRHRAGKALLSIAPKLSADQINEIVIELTKGLEIGKYEFSKYIPEYLGALALFLHPNELNEFIYDLTKLLESTNERVASVTLSTFGIMIQNYPLYKERFIESKPIFEKRRKDILGILLKGLADYHEGISQEAFLVIGQNLFGSSKLSHETKYEIFELIYKKLLTLFVDQHESQLSFYNNSASLNHIYRFISDYNFRWGNFKIKEPEKVAFFPGTFDPFSLSHKGIVQEIKNLGFEVLLALDEFSWSKKTQPRVIRKKIINMSVGNEMDVYLFPDNIPVNIANPLDLKRFSQLFPDKEIYIVVGSDVINNASSYQTPPSPYSIHHFNHVVFSRSTYPDENAPHVDSWAKENSSYNNILGKVIELSLPMYLEDISSTRIRENIDYNRDISNLIDPIAQNYIYDNNLYRRESQYKRIFKAKAIHFEIRSSVDEELLLELSNTVLRDKENSEHVIEYLSGRKEAESILIRDGENNNQLVGFATFHGINISDLYSEFGDIVLAEQVRKSTSGKILIISGFLTVRNPSINHLEQLLLTEMLAHCLKNNYTYAIYNDHLDSKAKDVIKILTLQGFTPIEGCGTDMPILSVNMELPITIFKDIESTIKDPFDKNENIVKTISAAHEKMQLAITKLYPGNLVLSFHSDVIHYRLVDKITKENNVPPETTSPRRLGEFMCVPFGEVLKGSAVPNTVTKSLHTEKVFEPFIDRFNINEFPFYSPLPSQVRTIQSLCRPVILVDDLLHKGYRLKMLDPLFKEEDLNISKLIFGILSSRGKDLMDIQGRQVDSVYFIPNLRAWFSESNMYPFIGGNSVKRSGNPNNSLLYSINLILPYLAPRFLTDVSMEALYDFSMTCLENTRDILMAIEKEYPLIYERNLTLNRLSEAIRSPRYPDKGLHMSYDMNLPPSVYVNNDIEKLIRLKYIVK